MNFKMNFDETNQEFAALFEEQGNGKDGFSPIVEVEEIEGGNRVTITDKEGEKAFDVMDGRDGQDGEKGYTPQKGVDYWTETDKAEIVDDVLEQIPEIPSGASVQPDWSQNDPTAPDYVKNRTHWVENVFEPIDLENAVDHAVSLDFGSMLGIGTMLFYKVNTSVLYKDALVGAFHLIGNGTNQLPIEKQDIGFDFGDMYEILADEDLYKRYIIIIYAENVYGIPIGFYINDGVWDDTNGVNSSAIGFICKETVVPVDEKFIPDTISRVAQAEGSKFDRKILIEINNPSGSSFDFYSSLSSEELNDFLREVNKQRFDISVSGSGFGVESTVTMVFMQQNTEIWSSGGIYSTTDGIPYVIYSVINTSGGEITFYAETLVTKSDYDALEARIKALEG